VNSDTLFLRFTYLIFAVLFLYGLGMVIVVLSDNDTLALRLINGFATMFAAVIGFGTGYLLGHRNAESESGPDSK
jgi:uncharacterized membrane protein YgaE (UPF0421/DUF939 family)